MSQGLCPSCGAAVKLTAGQTDTKCHYCDSVVTLQQAEAQLSEVKHSKFAGSLMIAETAQEGGSYAEAINYFNKVIEQEPTFADAWLNKGICLVGTATIGDLKIPEAISSWKTAIKFAKNPEAMKKRVATEITAVVERFYEHVDQLYIQHPNLDNALDEHVSQFLLLESALSLALELNPSVEIANCGIWLCNHFDTTVKAVDGNLDDAESVARVEIETILGPELATKLKSTMLKYEQILAQYDPKLAVSFASKQQQERLAAAEKQGEVSNSKMATGCGRRGLVLLGLGLIAYFSSPSGEARTIANWPNFLLMTVGIVVVFRFFAKRLLLAKEAAIDFIHSANATSPEISFKDEEMIASVERGLVNGCSSAGMRKALVEVLKERGLSQTEGLRYLQAFDGIQEGRDIATLGLSDTPVPPDKHPQALDPTEPTFDSVGASKNGGAEQQAKAKPAQDVGALGIEQVSNAVNQVLDPTEPAFVSGVASENGGAEQQAKAKPAQDVWARGIEQVSNAVKSIFHAIARIFLMLFFGVVLLFGGASVLAAMLSGKESAGFRIVQASVGLASVAGGIFGLRKINRRNATSKG